MTQVSDAVAGRVVFELDRFAMTGDDRCVVEGCWFGVRGRRFMRPSLTVMVEGNETRLLADLADKPWAAEDGEPWRASFPIALEINGIEKAELTVAPDITIALRSTPDAPGGRKRKPAGGRSDSARTRSRGDAGERQRRELTRAIDRVEAEKAQIAGRLDDLLGQLSQVARERDEVARERDQLIAERDELSGERDRLMTERDSVQRERDEISAELAAARSARGEALTANKAARLAYDRALADRDAATAAHRQAEADRDSAIADRDRAIAERDGAFALRDHAVTERDGAVAARDEIALQRDALARTSERLQSELAELTSTRGAALVMRRAVQERSSRRSPVVGPIAMAILVLLAVVVVLLVTRAL